MLRKSFTDVYSKFKLQFYRRVFDLVRERDGSLSAMEAFALEVIGMLGKPTVGQFAEFLNISQSNATYKVNHLIQKGYVEKIPSQEDRREIHLQVTDKYMRYWQGGNEALSEGLRRLENRFTPQEMETFSRVIRALAETLPDRTANL